MGDEAVRVGADGLARTPWAYGDALLLDYYDNEWGRPITDETGLFERISLEAFQSGLSWLTILRKRDAFREAFCEFEVDKVANFGSSEIETLMANAAIVRNRAKIDATIANARAVVALRQTRTLGDLVWSFTPEATPVPVTTSEVPVVSPESRAMAKEMRSLGFSFVGPKTAFALMEAIGMVDTHLAGSYRRGVSGIWS